jgi:hypothetical protein
MPQTDVASSARRTSRRFVGEVMQLSLLGKISRSTLDTHKHLSRFMGMNESEKVYSVALAASFKSCRK